MSDISIYHNHSEYLYNSCKHRAIKNKLEFNITPEDIIIPRYCPYLGIKLTNIRSKKYIPSNPSVDRIDNTKGYIKANMMKNDATLEQLEDFAINVLLRHSKVEVDYE